MASKWKFDSGGTFVESPSKVESVSRNRSTSSSAVLLDAVRNLGVRDIELDELRDCPEAVHSLLWKLVSSSQEGVRLLEAEREKTARLEHEVKLLRNRNEKLNEEISKQMKEKQGLVAEHQRREEEYRTKIDSMGRSRLEWEKAALEYRGREKHFVAEIKKQENQYNKFQDRVRRSLSVVNRTCPPKIGFNPEFSTYSKWS